MLIAHSTPIKHPNLDKPGFSYSPSLEAAVQLILADPAFHGDPETSSYKFIRAARFLKYHAPHVFHVREMGAASKNKMDRWLWDLVG